MAHENNRSFWQRAALFYNRAKRGDSAVYEEICDRIRPYLSGEKNVLELGCGTGLITHRLAPLVKYWEATDYSEAMIRQAKKQKYGPKLHFSVQDAMALPFAEGTFDTVVIVNAMHAIEKPEKALTEIRRVLSDDGFLIAPDYVQDGERRQSAKKLLASFTGLRTYSKWTAKEYIELMEQNGFELVERHRIGQGVREPVCFAVLKKTI